MRILLTNDDGITSRGLFEAKVALDEIADVAVIAPDSNRSAIGRAITVSRSLTVTEVELRDGTVGYATDGTPVDCVRFADLGLVGERPDLIVSGINYGVNLGDDVTYSGTVAAAFEGIVLGIPGIAISQQSVDQTVDFKRRELYDFAGAATFLKTLVGEVGKRGLPDAHDPERERASATSQGSGSGPVRAAHLPRPARPRVRLRGAPQVQHLWGRSVVSRRAGHRLRGDRARADRGHTGASRSHQPVCPLRDRELVAPG